MQIDAGLDRIEDADRPIPAFIVHNATLWEGAVVDVTITDPGLGYSASDCDVETTTGTGGFEGSITVNAQGEITSVVITSHGNYSATPTLQLTGALCSPTSAATLTAYLGPVIYANMTNTGTTTIAHDDMWLYFDGNSPMQFSQVYQNPISSENWYTGESLNLVWNNATIDEGERFALSISSVASACVLE